MTYLDTIRAWKDEEYRLSLSEAEQAQLPAHPAGLIELTDAQLDDAAGGCGFWCGVAAGVVGNIIYGFLNATVTKEGLKEAMAVAGGIAL
jgi:mersacidin/lichenicidin family type 2 lantibiotic